MIYHFNMKALAMNRKDLVCRDIVILIHIELIVCDSWNNFDEFSLVLKMA